MKLYYVANTRMPNEWAHGIQIAKMCEAFVREGIEVTLVVPRRAGIKASLKEFYGLSVPIEIVRLPVFDRYRSGSFWYRVSSISFMLASVAYLWWKKIRGEQFILYTVDLDSYSSSQLALVPAPLYSEMHGGKEAAPLTALLFRRVRGIIATTPITMNELEERFPRSTARYTVEPNGVDVEAFTPVPKLEARATLGLPADERIVVYSGRMFGWKGLEILRDAAAKTPGVRWYIVGGTKEEYQKTTGPSDIPDSMIFMGSQPHAQIPLWLSAADALIVLGTKRDTQSYYWTSPMKLFEYLLSERPIVAADTPAIRSVVSAREVLFYEPDSAESMAEQIERAFAGGETVQARTDAARTLGTNFSWEGRARRIRQFMGI